MPKLKVKLNVPIRIAGADYQPEQLAPDGTVLCEAQGTYRDVPAYDPVWLDEEHAEALLRRHGGARFVE